MVPGLLLLCLPGCQQSEQAAIANVFELVILICHVVCCLDDSVRQNVLVSEGYNKVMAKHTAGFAIAQSPS